MADGAQKQTFFSKVSTRKERERAFVLMTDSKTNLECQLKDKTVVQLTADSLKDSMMIVKADIRDIPSDEDVIVTFNIGLEKYFMKTKISGHDFFNHFCLHIDAPLFKLQRRDSFRVNIPQGYLAKITITQIDKTPVNKKFPLFDLSGGGISFEIPPENGLEIERNQFIFGEMEIGGKFKKPFSAIVRHSIRVGSQGSGLKKVGAEFHNMSPTESQEIVKIVMDLHRDLFSKFKIGSR